MSPLAGFTEDLAGSFPRASGDEPTPEAAESDVRKFSPRERG